MSWKGNILKQGCDDDRATAELASNVVPFHSVETGVARPTDDASAIPAGYAAGADGVYALVVDDAGDVHHVRICSPIAVVGCCRRTDSTGWGRVVELVDPDNRTHRIILNDADISSTPATLLRPLIDRGLQIEGSANTKKRLADLLGAWRPEQMILRVARTGWVDDDFNTFVFADGSVIGLKQVILESNTGTIGKAVKVKGSLDLWRDMVAAPCAGNPLMLLALSQAFVGPLLGLLKLDGCGFHLHGASTSGKTTLVKIAASVWGSPDYHQSWRATDNALKVAAASCNDALLPVDEIYEVSPKILSEVVYMLANGRGKQRMTGAGKGVPVDSWRVASLSNGEISVKERMASGGQKIHAGQEIRMIDIQADCRRFRAFDHLVSTAE